MQTKQEFCPARILHISNYILQCPGFVNKSNLLNLLDVLFSSSRYVNWERKLRETEATLREAPGMTAKH